MATLWLHKVRTGSGSDRVVSETPTTPVITKVWPYLEKTNDCACVSTRSLPLPVLTLCSHAVTLSEFASDFGILYWKYRVISEPIHFPTGTETPFPIIL